MRCNGEAPEDWAPFEVFDELRKTPFRPRKGTERHVAEVKDTLLGFAAFKDLQVSVEAGAEAEVLLEVLDLWVVPKRATGDADIGDVCGVALEDEDEATDEEDLDRASKVANSSSSDLLNLPALSSTSAPSANPSAWLVFKYHVDEAVMRDMERGKLHEWTNVEFHAICKKHGLSVRGAKGLGHANYPPLTTQTCALCRLFCVLFLCLCFPCVACTVIGGEE